MDGWQNGAVEREREVNKLLVSLDSSVETQGRVGEGEEEEGSGLKEEEEEEEEKEEEEVCFEASAAAPSSLLASLAAGQCGVGGRMLGSNLNTISLIVDIKHSLLNLLIDLLGCVDESLLYIRGSLGWGLHEYEAMFSGKCFTFLFLHLSPRLQVTLVANEHDDHIGVGMLASVL